jgi:hypothetical protein
MFPSRDPGPRRHIVRPLGLSSDADRTDLYAVDGKRDPAAHKINLTGMHIHNAKEAVGPGRRQFTQKLRALSVKR